MGVVTSATAVTPPSWAGDWATDDLWRLIWYVPAHEGWEFGSYSGPALIERAVAELPVRATDRVLHLGADAGETCHYLSLRLGCRVTAVEPDPVRLGHARRRLRTLPPTTSGKIRITAGSPDPGHYDRVLALQPARAGMAASAVLRRAAAALRPGGRLMLSEVVRRTNPPPPAHAPVGLLRRLRHAGFDDARAVNVSDEAAFALRSAQLGLIRRHRAVVRHAGTSGADRLLALIQAAQDDVRSGRTGLWSVSATRSSAAGR